jgi:hypothetical protein
VGGCPAKWSTSELTVGFVRRERVSSNDLEGDDHREDAKSAKEVEEPAHNPLTIRLMPSLIRGTFQFTNPPRSRLDLLSRFFLVSSLRVLGVFVVRNEIGPMIARAPVALASTAAVSGALFAVCRRCHQLTRSGPLPNFVEGLRPGSASRATSLISRPLAGTTPQSIVKWDHLGGLPFIPARRASEGIGLGRAASLARRAGMGTQVVAAELCATRA